MKIRGSLLFILTLTIFFASLVSNGAKAAAVIGTITVPGSYPGGVVYDSGKGLIYVTNVLSDSVSAISDATNTIIATIPVEINPSHLAYDSGKGLIYVTNGLSNSVSVISDDTNIVIATIPVGTVPSGAAYDSGKGLIYVSNSDDNTISVISDDTNTVIATISVGNSPSGLVYDYSKGEIFVVNILDNAVSVISDDTNTVVATIAVEQMPKCIAYDSGKGLIYVTNGFSNSVSVISDDTNSVVTSIPVGKNPRSIVYDSDKDLIFVSTIFADSLSVISDSTNTVVATIPVAQHTPGGIAYDSAKGEIFVANGIISIISDDQILQTPTPTPTITAAPTGIPSNSSVLSATSIATIKDNSAAVDHSAVTGVNVTVSGVMLQDGAQLEVTSTNYGNSSPLGVGNISAKGAVFYDIRIMPLNNQTLTENAFAQISFSDSSFIKNSQIGLWNGSAWVWVTTTFLAPDTVSCVVSALALTGTPIVVGTAETSSMPQVEPIYIVIAGAAIIFTVFVSSVLLLLKRKRANTHTH